MKLSWHGHSIVLIETINNYRVIIDPFITGNNQTDLDVETISVDYIVLTHAHNDHVGDSLELSLRCNAPIIAMVELAEFMEKLGATVLPVNIGGTVQLPFGSLKLTPAIHSSSYNYLGNNYPLGLAAGIIIDDGSARIYHAGDTALFTDMLRIGPVDCAFVPIGDQFTMGIEDAAEAINLVQPRIAIPIHYNTFKAIEKNPYEFTNRLEDNNGYVPEIGEIITL